MKALRTPQADQINAILRGGLRLYAIGAFTGGLIFLKNWPALSDRTTAIEFRHAPYLFSSAIISTADLTVRSFCNFPGAAAGRSS